MAGTRAGNEVVLQSDVGCVHGRERSRVWSVVGVGIQLLRFGLASCVLLRIQIRLAAMRSLRSKFGRRQTNMPRLSAGRVCHRKSTRSTSEHEVAAEVCRI